MKIYLIAKCIQKKDDFTTSFHFRGVFNGEQIKIVSILEKAQLFKKNQFYLIYLDVVQVEGQILYGNCLSSLDLEKVMVDL